MEVKAELKAPYTEEEKINFIITYNHNLGYEIKKVETGLQALGYTQAELDRQEEEQIAQLHLTRGDVFRGVLKATGKTKSDIRQMIELMPEKTPEEIQAKELAKIDFDDSLDFYRGVPIVDTIGNSLGIKKEQLDKFFRTNDYKDIIPIV